MDRSAAEAVIRGGGGVNGLVDFSIGTAAISSSVLVGCLIVLLLWIICRRPAIFSLHLHCS